MSISTVAPPTYVEGAAEPLSTDLSGNLRVLDTTVQSAIENHIVVLGQTTMDNSVPVTIASDETPIPITRANETFINRGFQAIPDLSVAVGLSVPSGSTLVILSIETSSIRWRDDGVDPTAIVGMLLLPGQTFIYNGDLSAIKFIDVTSGAAIVANFYQ
jgi:hypothetical protein